MHILQCGRRRGGGGGHGTDSIPTGSTRLMSQSAEIRHNTPNT